MIDPHCSDPSTRNPFTHLTLIPIIFMFCCISAAPLCWARRGHKFSVLHLLSQGSNRAFSSCRLLCLESIIRLDKSKRKGIRKGCIESSGLVYKRPVGDIIEIPYSPTDCKLRVYFDWCDLSWHWLLVLPSNDVLLCKMMGSTHGRLLLLSELHILWWYSYH